jgi:cellulose biosynthesis protein BcsQ
MFSISIFNNKGGVGKTTLSFHFAHALALLKKKVLIVDLDPQCNLTILSMPENNFFSVWDREEKFVPDFGIFEDLAKEQRGALLKESRSIHFLLKSAEDGQTDFIETPPPVKLGEYISIIPGRLTLHSYEDKVGERWANAYKGDPLAVRTITQIRTIAQRYAEQYNYDFIIYDTSPSLGMLNRVILSMADGFIIPCLPDKFSLYGIKNIGNALRRWKSEFDIILSLQGAGRKKLFPERFVRFLGYTIYNARPYKQTPQLNKWDLANGHFHFAKQIPETIKASIPQEIRHYLSELELDEPIGGTSVMHTHNTLPNVSQKYHVPIWDLPDHKGLDPSDKNTIRVNRDAYNNTRSQYSSFAESVIDRIDRIKLK